MKNIPLKKAATKDEFYQTVEGEFAFLVSEHGYAVEIKTSPYAVEYTHANLCVRISSITHGFSIEFEFLVDGESLPVWPIISKMVERKTPVTDKPQLDDIREYAWRLRQECPALLEGDNVLIGTIRDTMRDEEKRIEHQREEFFDVAEILFETGQYGECVKHLRKNLYELPEDWTKRLDYARKQIDS